MPASFRDRAAEVLTALLNELRARQRGAYEGADPEELHDMRVAVRRLRAALASFASALPETATVARNELQWLGRALAPVRDLDVQRAAVRQWLCELDADDRLAVQALPTLLQEERSAARADLVAVLDSERYAALLQTLGALAGRGISPARASKRMRRKVPALIKKRYRKLRRITGYLRAHSTAAEFHVARKRARRLRYDLEFASDVYGRAAKKFLKRLKTVQAVLGSHQDAVVAIHRLQALSRTHAPQLPEESIFLMSKLADRYAQDALDARSQLQPAYAQLRGKRWRALRKKLTTWV